MQTTLYLNIPTIGITGSFGKTTVKEITAAILSVKYETYKSPKNFNLVDQTKKHVKNINDEHEVVVIEMAMSKKNRGKRQCTVIQPNIGVITAVGHAHFERFSSIKDVALSKSEMMKYMKPEGTLYLSNDDENSKLVDTQYFPGEIIKVGLSEGSDYRATNIRFNKKGMEFEVVLNGKSEAMFVPLLGEHSVVNSLFAIGIADKLGLTPDEIREGLGRVELPRGRLTLDYLEGNRTLIDDSYNANPVSMVSGLKVLNEYIDSPNKIALLGDMAEMGSYTREGHEKVGKSLIDFTLDKVFLYGDSSKWILKKAEETGFPKEKLFHFDDIESLIEEIEKSYSADTALLVKASRATKLDQVVKHLLSKYSI
ncbi:UDP-N-acetylmuramoyl-tripeptide--D-alanyl-D-alanine ligase [Oceanobacillus profundus]|uniref:UDP-N-acetylmuramoyl-tripeptide--D-alanyl-D-alanine ligase n=1 Tax=Oceanobacillus profundus TaxID=372463 RepID=A0A417YPG7_9BACI|nr:UDP-N-acetylmuramoyl-tripeptide--D-alanyl-D-alanine ligase [Oceanobacillus profundus]RHW35510.1 UDP-N-acetylmuramoyl-tripeptide--D-alanyl-D-alanine ligase [Oceanobacillus profundus]